MSFAATDPTYCRVTVLAPRTRVDVALPADLPVAELVPMVLELVGEPVVGRPTAAVAAVPDRRRSRCRPVRACASSACWTASCCGSPRTGRPPPAPVFDDPVDALAATAGTGADSGTVPTRSWSCCWRRGGRAAARRPAGPVGAVPAESPAGRPGGIPAGPGAGRGTGRGGRGGLGGPRGPPAASGARSGRPSLARHARRPRPTPPASEPHATDDDRLWRRPPPGARSTTCPPRPRGAGRGHCAAAAGWAALPGATAPVRLLVAAAAAGGAAALGPAGRAGPGSRAGRGDRSRRLPVGAAAWSCCGWAVPPSAAAVAVGALALVAGPLLPRAALWLSGMPRPVVPADADELVDADDGPDLLPAAELARAGRAGPRLPGRAGRRGRGAGRGRRAPGGRRSRAGPARSSPRSRPRCSGCGRAASSTPARRRALAAGALASGVGLAVVLAWSSGPWAGPVAAAALLLVAAASSVPRSRGRWAHRSGGEPSISPKVLLTAAVVPLALAALDLYRRAARAVRARDGSAGCRRQVEHPTGGAQVQRRAGGQQRQHRRRGRLRRRDPDGGRGVRADHRVPDAGTPRSARPPPTRLRLRCPPPAPPRRPPPPPRPPARPPRRPGPARPGRSPPAPAARRPATPRQRGARRRPRSSRAARPARPSSSRGARGRPAGDRQLVDRGRSGHDVQRDRPDRAGHRSHPQQLGDQLRHLLHPAGQHHEVLRRRRPTGRATSTSPIRPGTPRGAGSPRPGTAGVRSAGPSGSTASSAPLTARGAARTSP